MNLEIIPVERRDGGFEMNKYLMISAKLNRKLNLVRRGLFPRKSELLLHCTVKKKFILGIKPIRKECAIVFQKPLKFKS
jgi:hypothetical protein